MKLPSIKRSSVPPDERIPRGAIAVVVVGLIATLAAAVLSGGGATGDAAHLEWVQQAAIPASKPATVPGSNEAKMVLLPGRIQATGTNVAGWSLFRVLTTLRIDEGAPIGSGKILCSTHATRSETLIGQSEGGLRTTYPRSSAEGIYGQPVPEEIVVRFASHGHPVAFVETGDMPTRFTTIQGVKLNWPKYEVDTENIEYFLPEGKAKTTVKLPFYTVWRSRKAPAATISCTLTVSAGKATVRTEGALPNISPPINEEAEAAAAEKREEAEEREGAAGEGEEAEGE
ncbi:MAG TPA: hypothetical protein VHA76_13690 [Solirubrobacterales bacterium]|nr:hypothetical protein [Solirubrobacterales bacterium]